MALPKGLMRMAKAAASQRVRKGYWSIPARAAPSAPVVVATATLPAPPVTSTGTLPPAGTRAEAAAAVIRKIFRASTTSSQPRTASRAGWTRGTVSRNRARAMPPSSHTISLPSRSSPLGLRQLPRQPRASISRAGHQTAQPV